MSDGAIVFAKGLTKDYPPDVRAVDGVDLEISAGEIFGLLGPNGAGKTTTIKILVTLARPTSGTASVCGYDVVAEPQRVRECIGYVSQQVALDPSITAWDNLWLHANLHHMAAQDARRRIDEVLALVELADRAKDRVKTYSGGMKKRLDLATGLLHRPRLLVLDEPTLGLDLQTRVRIWEYLREQKRQGMTILVTTHYLEEADRLARRIAIVSRGRAVVEGAPDELKRRLLGDAVTVELADGKAEAAAEVVARLGAVEEAVVDGRHLRARVDRGAEAVPAILSALEGEGMAVASVTVSRPSLDDVYLHYTGRDFRAEDEAGSAG